MGCSSSDPGPSDPGLVGENPNGDQTAKNFYGVPYPTDNIGTNARKGDVRGNRIKNSAFDQGYVFPAAGEGQGTQRIQLADFYDPEMRKYKLLHLSVAAVWCGPCNEETRQLVEIGAKELERGVVTLQALNQDAQGRPATLADLDAWIRKHGTAFNQVVDPKNEFGPFFNAASIPWNGYIDLRTMEILASYEGSPVSIEAEDTKYLNWIDSHPPSY